jgi:uncharacterized protein
MSTLLTLVIFLAALLYSSVGQAGASGYLAAMALFGLPPEVMKPTALTLNILVASIGTYKYTKAGCFSWSQFWPFTVASVPFAFIGGLILLPAAVYQPVVGLILIFAAYRLAFFKDNAGGAGLQSIPLWPALFFGSLIGLVSGMTGVGGGIFLSPLLLIMNWAEPKKAAGLSAAFILVNSASALLGHLSSVAFLPAEIPYWAAAAAVGGFIGAEFGSRRLGSSALRLLLAVILVLSGIRILVG